MNFKNISKLFGSRISRVGTPMFSANVRTGRRGPWGRFSTVIHELIGSGAGDSAEGARVGRLVYVRLVDRAEAMARHEAVAERLGEFGRRGEGLHSAAQEIVEGFRRDRALEQSSISSLLGEEDNAIRFDSTEGGFAASPGGRLCLAPLQRAIEQCNLAALERLIDLGADLNAKDDQGMAPLHWAAIKGSAPMIGALAEAGADFGSTHYAGWTPLHWAAIKGHEDVARALLVAGADPLAADEAGKTALDHAEEKGHGALAEILSSAGSAAPLARKDAA